MEAADLRGREKILERISKALEASAPRHEFLAARTSQIFPPVGDPLERFQKECAANLTECAVTSDSASSATAIEKILASLPPGELFLQDAPEFRRMAQAWGTRWPLRWSSGGGPRESCEAALTLAELLVALTGSILVSASCGGRGASVVAPCHIVLARQEQLVPDLETALARAREKGLAFRNSYLGLITGSSRTADVEKRLVIGAHGPRRLVVIVQTRT